MIYRTVIDMENKNALITKSMLSSYLTSNKWNYLKLLEPFVKKELSLFQKGLINLEDLKNNLNKNFGLDIKQNVLSKILRYMAKEKNGKYIQRIKDENNKFLLIKDINSIDFDKNMNKIKVSSEKVIDELTNYMNKNSIKKYSVDDSKHALLSFLETYNYEVMKDVNATRLVKKDNKCKENYLVAHFILDEHDKNSTVYSEIQEIQKGHFASNAIYYFMSGDADDSSKKIKGTAFYLDTSILIDVLGLNYEQDKIATEELIRLILNNGGKLVTFIYYIEELQGIITKFKNDIESRLTIDLDLFRREKYSKIQLELYQNKLESKLKELGIEIIYETDYSSMVKSCSWHIDEEKLKSELKKNVGYKDSEISDALTNDLQTIREISYLRGEPKKCNVENCKCLFITDNTQIIYTIKNLYYDDRFKIGELPFAMTDIDLTAYLWLSNAEIKSNLPEIVLLENAYAAIKPSNEVMKEACRLIDNEIKLSDGECKEDAMLLRFSYSLRDDIVELTKNDIGNITDDTIVELLNKQKNRVKKEVEIDCAQKNRYKEQEIENREKEVNDKTLGIIIQEEKLNSKEKYLEKGNKNLIEKTQNFLKIKENYEKSKFEESNERKQLKADSDAYKKLRSEEYQNCQNKAKKTSKFYYVLIVFLGSILLFIFCLVMFYVTFRTSYAKSVKEWLVYIIPTLLSVLGIYGYFKKFLIFAKFIEKRINDNSLDKRLKKSKIINQI